MQDYRKLIVWEKSRQLVLEIYKVSAKFPKEEMYGLTSQLRRACVSISANIAEGCGRGSKAELSRYIQIALGSASEAECEFLLSRDLGYVSSEEFIRLQVNLEEVKKMLASLERTLKTEKNKLPAKSGISEKDC